MGALLETTSIGRSTIIAGWVFTIIAFIAVLIQAFICLWVRRRFGLEDLLLHVSFVLSITLQSLTTRAVFSQGQGQHIWHESRAQLEAVAQSLLLNEILWGLVNTFLRLAAIIFAKRLFVVCGYRNFLWWFLCLLLVFSIGYGVAVVVTPLYICKPMSASWDSTVKGECGNEIVAYIILEVAALLIDGAILVVPFPIIIRMNMSRKAKLGIIPIFAVGSLVFIITGLRIAALDKVNSHDFTYDSGYIGLLSILGPLIGIISGCVPTFPHAWSHFEPFLRSKAQRLLEIVGMWMASMSRFSLVPGPTGSEKWIFWNRSNPNHEEVKPYSRSLPSTATVTSQAQTLASLQFPGEAHIYAKSISRSQYSVFLEDTLDNDTRSVRSCPAIMVTDYSASSRGFDNASWIAGGPTLGHHMV